MHKAYIMLIVFIAPFFITSCSPSNDAVIVAEFGKDNITYDELKEAYYKSLSEEEKSKADSPKEMKEFLDLYVNYKMKLRDAYIRGFESDPEVQKEIDDYTKTVGIPYIQEKFIVEPGSKDLYEKRKIEKRISHILLRTDTVNVDDVRRKIKSLLERVKNGESFEELAYQYTDDDFSRPDSGDVYWLTAGQTVPEFDEAMYKTKKGEVYPEPIQSKFGFHLLKVTDEQPRVYQVKARHILASYVRGTEVDTAAALAKIKEVKEKLNSGEAFDELAKKFSDDEGSAQRGGDLDAFQRRMMVKPFDEVVFSMKVGEISDIVETRFGFHIIQLLEILDYPTYEEDKANIKSIYQRSLYANDKEKYLSKLKDDYSFKRNENLIEEVMKSDGSLTFGDSYWESEYRNKYGDSVVISMLSKDYTLDDIVGEFKDRDNYKNAKMTQMNVFKMFLDITEEMLFTQKAFELRDGDTEFARLMDDYRNGLYIFKLQEDEIWNKLSADSTQLLSLYEETKENYNWPDRVSYAVIYRPDSLSILDDKSVLDSGIEFETVVEANSTNPRLKNKTGIRESVEVANNELAKAAFRLNSPGEISEPFRIGNDWYIIKLNEKFPSTPKSFDEARSEVMGVWQERQSKKLEQDYINKLNQVYKPKLYYERLQQTQKS